MTDQLLSDTKRYPGMTRWFSPWLLLKLINNVVVSSIFGQYADRRLIIAALDTVEPAVHLQRAEAFRGKLDGDGDEIWIDWVADLGDGFDSTYAVASLLSAKTLTVEGVTTPLPRGQALIMGGDEVYPLASRQAYYNQLRQPYAWASPDHDKSDDKGRPVLAIPGNHDWYDGLVLFLALFCKEKPWHIGSLRTCQRRSYFAVRLTEDWWLWATDVQLLDDMDKPQADYFTTIAQGMPENSNIILCSAEPGWLYTDTNRSSWEIMEYAAGIARKAGKNHSIPLILSGDTHHYSRYESDRGRQFITSGGGGAFLHPTHQLEKEVSVVFVDHRETLKLGVMTDRSDAKKTTEAAYPSFSKSRALTFGNIFFAFTNWDFSLLMGAIYFLFAVLISLHDYPDAYVAILGAFAAGLIGYSFKQEASKKGKIWGSSFAHAVVQTAVTIAASRWFADFNAHHFTWTGRWWELWEWLGILAIEMVPVGFVFGGTIFGLNMLFTCLFLRMNRNDGFSSLRLGSYKNFVRLKLKKDGFEVYAIGLDRVPNRSDWYPNPKHQRNRPDPEVPVYLSKVGIQPHLIEKVALSFPAKGDSPPTAAV